jgi:hypothetical protein
MFNLPNVAKIYISYQNVTNYIHNEAREHGKLFLVPVQFSFCLHFLKASLVCINRPGFLEYRLSFMKPHRKKAHRLILGGCGEAVRRCPQTRHPGKW